MLHSSEKRQNARSCTVYKPARVELNAQSFLALMTDVSAGGAGLTCPIPVTPGTRLRRATGDEPLRTATVVWTAHEQFGVTFDEQGTTQMPVPAHNYRSVRVPTDIPAKVYVNGVCSRARIVNLAPRGLAIETDTHLPVGAMFSLEALDQVFEGVTVRWCEQGRIGARLPLQVRMNALQDLIVRATREAEAGSRLRRVG